MISGPSAAHADNLVMAAPVSAIMMVGEFEFVDVTAGLMDASITRHA